MFNIIDYNQALSFFVSIDWKNAITGVFLGWIIADRKSIGYFGKNIFFDKNQNYYGTYYLYNWSVADKTKISEKKIIIKRNFFSNPRVELYIQEHVNLKYQGSFQETGKNLYFNLYGSGHTEELNIVFHEPLNHKIEILIGVFSAITVDGQPFSAKILISNQRLDHQNAQDWLGSQTLLMVTPDYLRTSITRFNILNNDYINKDLSGINK